MKIFVISVVIVFIALVLLFLGIAFIGGKIEELDTQVRDELDNVPGNESK